MPFIFIKTLKDIFVCRHIVFICGVPLFSVYTSTESAVNDVDIPGKLPKFRNPPPPPPPPPQMQGESAKV